MKKLIIASVLAATALGAQASETTVKICDAALTSFYGSKITDYQQEAAIVSDNGGQFSVLLLGSDDVLVSPELTLDVKTGFLATSNGVTFMKLKGGSGYSAGMEDKDIRINFVNCKSGRGV